MMDKVIEGKAECVVGVSDVVSRKLEVFYNPLMKYNRDISIQVIDSYFLKYHPRPIKIALPMEGSGIRGVRFFLECKAPIEAIYFNDISANAVKVIEENTKQFPNKFISKELAQVFLYQNRPFDYIDVDPFGSSIPFIKAAVNSTYSGGIIAVTNTDTAALCGSYPEVCKRRYGAVPYNHSVEQEFGLRILIRKVQEIAMEDDVALIPIFAYSRSHYMRIFFKSVSSKTDCKKILSQHKFVEFDEFRLMSISDKSVGENVYGPIWTGKLCDDIVASSVDSMDKFTELVKQENLIDQVLFYDPHELCKKLKKSIPRYDKLIEVIQSKGYLCSRTSFCKTGIKTNMPKDLFLALLKSA